MTDPGLSGDLVQAGGFRLKIANTSSGAELRRPET
jgi:hypothetical protein